MLDALSRVGVVDKLMSPSLKLQLEKDNHSLQKQLAESYQQRNVKLVPLADARARRFTCDWAKMDIPQPAFLGVRALRDFPLAEIAQYIDWSPFFMTWELKGKYPRIFDDPAVGPQAKELFSDARKLLDQIIREKLLTANGVYGFWPANSEGDDIVLLQDVRLHTLRQQWERQGQKDFRALADYIAPLDSGRTDYLGAFAVTTGIGCDQLCTRFDREHDDYNSIMAKALADRLAEAFAELLHQRVRREWGYGKTEQLSHDELIE
jgi:5-methyltetrahydrofolate--homocysteine methyltransferase